MALLVLLAAAAGARIVSSHLGLVADDGRPGDGPRLGARRSLEDHLALAGPAPLLLLALLLGHRLEEKDVPDDLVLDPVLHLREQIEGFPLVLDQRVLLSISAQADPLLQMVHGEKVVLPPGVD